MKIARWLKCSMRVSSSLRRESPLRLMIEQTLAQALTTIFEMKRMVTPPFKERTCSKNNVNGRVAGRDLKNMLSSRAVPHKPSLSKLPMESSHRIFIRQELAKTPQVLSVSDYLKSKCVELPATIRSADVNGAMRKLVMEWGIQATHRMNLSKQTLFMSAHLYDYMVGASQDFNSENLQLLEVTALFMAAKYHEIYPPQLSAFLEVTNCAYLRREVLELEEKILTLRGFQLGFPTRHDCLAYKMGYSNDYLRQYDRAGEVSAIGEKDKRLKHFILYLLEVSLLVQWQNCSENDISEAATYLGCLVFRKKMQHRFQVSERLMENAYKLISVWKENEDGVVARLYDTEKYDFVGGTKIRY